MSIKGTDPLSLIPSLNAERIKSSLFGRWIKIEVNLGLIAGMNSDVVG